MKNQLIVTKDISVSRPLLPSALDPYFRQLSKNKPPFLENSFFQPLISHTQGIPSSEVQLSSSISSLFLRFLLFFEVVYPSHISCSPTPKERKFLCTRRSLEERILP